MLCIDIETVPTTAALAAPFDPASVTVPSNYKSQEAIDKYIKNAESDWRVKRVKDCSLNPRLGRILCVGYQLDGDPIATLYAPTEADEAHVLRQFWALCKDADAHPIVTWNGQFDLRYLVVRSLAHDITPTIAVPPLFRRYAYDPHFDCKAALLQEWGSRVAGEGLDEWAQFFDLGESKTHHGADVYPMFCDGKHDEIRAYCEQDVWLTAAIYARIQPMFR